MKRSSARSFDEIRKIELIPNFSMHAEGSCLVKIGNTHVLCTASLDDNIPPFLKNKGRGWVTAEYGMLPRSTHSRMKREVTAGKATGRTHEIQRLISRSLRAVCDLDMLGERQILVDCDVIQADGGTRTASITGAYVALHYAFEKLVTERKIEKNPINTEVAAISCGIYHGNIIVDLDYAEDSVAEVDANFVITGNGRIVEVQGTAEHQTFDQDQLIKMLELANKATSQIVELQRKATRR